MNEITLTIQAAEENAPSADQVYGLQEAAENALAVHEEAAEKFKKAVVERARIFGWMTVSAETGLSPKQLHSWAKNIPGVDLSKVREATIQAGKEAADG